MQLMTWPLARLGSRFGLLFEPGRRRVMHSSLGRFLDRPLDLAVGLIEPDGTERVLPFTADGAPLYAAEQFERPNSITFRGYSERYGLRLELNFHSPFYPQNEALCLSPVIYVEIRVTWADRVRLRRFSKPPGSIPLFIRLRRNDTNINATEGRIDLAYDVPLAPQYAAACGNDGDQGSTDRVDSPSATSVHVRERIQSLNPGSAPVHDDHGGSGLQMDLPVTAEGSGIKWRLVWASYCGEPILDLYEEPVYLRYRRHWSDLDAVMDWATRHRDDNLALSR
ncbi:MAG: hypothetical protein OER86_10805, partial [Phycisphaerae bacterium]|nr:hypothetical protein [Phycisphaerae bacterium]